ncbi:UNVERIFIED_CONTAM: putative 2-oxoglutarate-dependent dioxygenase [Sesamum latifolium]|uniref:2-oxoglutarate-dependent dioxygenase n=1 Tax=Sesamum latifolium TaxID=2727402 RepID=A0AAW2V0L3_9LAMI
MGEVDPAFIQALEHRPKPHSVEAQGIPLIDLSPPTPRNSTPVPCRLSSPKLVMRARSGGFSRKFFALPKDEKKKVSRDEVNPYGYYDTEHTKNVRDWKEVFDFTVGEPMVMPASHEPDDRELKEMFNQWPENPSEMREVCEEYSVEMQKLGHKLLELIALSLGLERDRFNGFFKDQTTFIRLNHYAPCPIPDLALGVGRHKDGGALTILAQDDVGGLEVKRKTDGEWILVKPTPDAYIINVGDIIQVWSNDKYESVEHRVRVNSERERFSIPFFLNPAHYTMVEPLEELVNKQNPANYNAYNWGKFFSTRKRSNYKKLDVENIQIHHFKNY